MKALLLTLGHNASAIGLQDHTLVCGYEEERLTHRKADSRYPVNAIEAVVKILGDDIDEIHISHWFLNGELPKVPDKYFNGEDLYQRFPQAKIFSVGRDFTHHDAHAWAGLLFAESYLKLTEQSTIILVADGFGNFAETMSIYRLKDHKPYLIDRAFGFGNSLGLFYQYATAYLGLKENQDEYKLLGYETVIGDELKPEQIETLHKIIKRQAKKMFYDILNFDLQSQYDPFYAVDALPALRLHYKGHFEHVIRSLGMQPYRIPEASRRVIIAYYVQSVVETVVTDVVRELSAKNIILVGGLFMNVKLNDAVSETVAKQTCIMPLAGDQGCALGLYKSVHNQLHWPNHLFWGKRDLSSATLLTHKTQRWEVFQTDTTMAERVKELLAINKIVNIVRGSMEFGARALCHTSTLALPTDENVEYINTLNDRNTVMPMAPVMTRDIAYELFHGVDQIAGSEEYMICTRHYQEATFVNSIRGAAHQLPLKSVYTGRPQVTHDDFMLKVLDEFPVLINTSLNEHGMPICFSVADVLRCHEFQLRNDYERRVHTLIKV